MMKFGPKNLTPNILDFGLAQPSANDIYLLLQARQAGIMSDDKPS